jgi:hypothetical protein
MDPNDEYLGLFIDRAIDHSDEITYIHIGSDSLHESISNSLGKSREEIDQNVINIMRQQLRLSPKLFEESQSNSNFNNAINEALRNIIQRTRIMLPFEDVAELINKTVKEQIDERTGPEVRMAINAVLREWTDQYRGQNVNSNEILNAVNFIDPIDKNGNLSGLQDSKRRNAEGISRRVESFK